VNGGGTLLHPRRGHPVRPDGPAHDPFGACSRCTARSRRRERLRGGGLGRVSGGLAAQLGRVGSGSARPVTSFGLPERLETGRRRAGPASAGARARRRRAAGPQVLRRPVSGCVVSLGRGVGFAVQVAVPLQVPDELVHGLFGHAGAAASSVTRRVQSVPTRQLQVRGRSRVPGATRRTARPCRDCTRTGQPDGPHRPAAGVRARSDRTVDTYVRLLTSSVRKPDEGGRAMGRSAAVS